MKRLATKSATLGADELRDQLRDLREQRSRLVREVGSLHQVRLTRDGTSYETVPSIGTLKPYFERIGSLDEKITNLEFRLRKAEGRRIDAGVPAWEREGLVPGQEVRSNREVINFPLSGILLQHLEGPLTVMKSGVPTTRRPSTLSLSSSAPRAAGSSG